MSFRLPVICVASVLALLVPAADLFAEFEFHPRLTVSEEYNDNLYLNEDNEQEDWITTIAPGLQLLYRNRSIDASVDYSLQYEFYKNNDDENMDQFKDIQRADASVLFFGGRPFTLQITETITRDQLDDSERYADYNELINRSTVYRTSVSPQYRLSLGQTMALVFGYTYNNTEWVDRRGDDTQEHIGRVSLEKELSSMTTLFAAYAYRVMESDASEDEFDRSDYSLGFRHQVGKRTSIGAEAGFSNVEYDSGYETDSTTWSADGRYQLSAALAATLTVSQDFTVTATDGLTKKRQAALGLEYQKDTVSADSAVFWSNSRYVRLDREDTGYGFRAGISNQFSNYFTGHLNGELEFAEYQESAMDEDVYRYTLGAALDYSYRRFLVSCEYRHRVNNSDMDANDYTNNLVTLSGTVRF